MFYSIPPAGSKIYFRDIFKAIKGSLTNPHGMEHFQEALKSYFGVKHCLLINSGRAALTAILMALKEKDDRDEVIIPSYTCFSVPAAIVRAGLKIGLCDIELETLDFNYEELEEIISEKTLAIVPCHLFGLVCDINRVIEIARRKNVWVIEDAAQAMGAKLNEEYVGTIGDVGFFSLGRGKPMTTMGGGVILTNNDQLKDKISSQIGILTQNSKLKTQNLKFILQSLAYSIFLNPRLYWIPEMFTFLHLGETIYDPEFSIGPFTKIQAQQGLVALKRLKGENALRYEKGRNYLKKLSQRNGMFSPKPIDASSPIYLRYPIILKDKNRRNNTYQKLKVRGLGSHFMYPSSIGEIDGIAANLNGKSNREVGKQLVDRLLTLPTHGYLREDNFKQIVNTLFYN
jgi:dTDP-4-amino-4,6-dideoxygalactose transaminase